MDEALYWLACQFESNEIIMQSCTAFEAGKYGAIIGTPDSHFVQILCINGNHWIVASNRNGERGTIQIYDSLPPSDLSK